MKIFAHRGVSGHFPENTHAAIKAALALKLDGIEVDLQSTSDDYAIIHDTWLERTTNGTGRVNKTPLAQVQTLDAGMGKKVPSLTDLLDWVNDQTLINLELKHTHCLNKLVADINAAIVDGKLSQQNLLISSFDHHQLVWIKHHLPWVKIGALTASIPLGYAQFAERLQAFSLHVDKNFINHEFVHDAKQRGLEVYAYTVDMPAEIEEMMALGIDGIFTNFPSESRDVVARVLAKKG